MNIYVGNLASDVSEDDLRQVFGPYAPTTVSLIKDKFSGESRGFGFVEIQNKEAAMKAIVEVTGKEIKGKCIIANEARPRDNNSRGGSGGGRGGRSSGGFGNRSPRRY
jgi:RNA recognition motif-containing protein